MSDYFVVRVPRKLAAGAAVVVAVALGVAIPLQVRGDNAAPGQDKPGRAKVLASQALPDIPGKQLTAVLVSYEPGGKSGPHHHAGDVFAFVVSGAIRSENSATGPAKVYQAGESFFEPAGSKHLVSENASATESARLLAVFVADAKAQLTTQDK
jgi:quercetin dioxygenase-like cupin family protein